MNIRPANDADIEALIRIGHAFFQFNPYRLYCALDEPSLTATLVMLMKLHVLLVAEVEGEVVGAAAAMIAPLYWNQSEFQGVELFWWLDPEHRGGGNGKRLRQALEDAVREKGVRFWNMIALEDSMPEKVDAMYRQAGFQPVERVYMKVIA